MAIKWLKMAIEIAFSFHIRGYTLKLQNDQKFFRLICTFALEIPIFADFRYCENLTVSLKKRASFFNYSMDLVAGAGGMMGQLAVGISGPGTASPGYDSAMSKLTKLGSKATIDSLPDKVKSCTCQCLTTGQLFYPFVWPFFT